jgi:hypothetical protein
MGVSISKVVTGGSAANALVQLYIYVQDSDWLGTFDYIEVERSRGLSTGPYEPMTGTMWAAARLPLDGGDEPSVPPVSASYDVVGLELLLRVNEGDDYTVTFQDPGSGVLSLFDAASQIRTALPNVVNAWVDADSRLVLETYETGTPAALRVVGGDAAVRLGLPTSEPYSLAYGKASKIVLQPGKEQYVFTDARGSSEYFYRTRFFGSALNTASAYSLPQPATQAAGVGAENLVTGQVRLASLNGKPLRGVNVRVFCRNNLVEAAGFVISGPQLSSITDEEGLASFTLIRGMDVSVAIDGTSLVREIRVPEGAEEGVFNLLDPSLGPDDYFRVKHPTIEYAQRRSL